MPKSKCQNKSQIQKLKLKTEFILDFEICNLNFDDRREELCPVR